MFKQVIIIGASGHGKVVADIIEQSGDQIVGFLDDDISKKRVLNYPVLGSIKAIRYYQDCDCIIAIGNNDIRRRIAENCKNVHYYTAIHPAAVVAKCAAVQPGSCVMANAVVNSSAVVGSHCIINTGVVVEHDCVVNDYVHLSPNATICGTVHIGENTHIGAGAVVRNNIKIAGNTIIGAGAVVVKNIDKPGIYVGVPARELV